MKFKWQDAPTRTQWGHDMVVTTVALGKDHSVDLYCERSKTAEAEALLKKPWGPQPDMHYGMNQEDWKDIVAAISKARDSRGIYLGCRPADVFQDWFLAMGLFKPKEKVNETN